jgi:histidinol-phosphate aminotransferase
MTPFPREAYRPLGRYAPDRRPVDLDLSDNTSRWGPHPAALRALRDAPDETLVRYPSVYADALRETIALRFGIAEESVTTGCGSDDLLDSTFRAAGEPGERVSYVPPTFSMVDTFARVNGLVPDPVPAEAAANPQVLVDRTPAVVYLCRPNNPTGEVRPRWWIEELVELAGSRGPILLLDEAYADYADDDFLGEAAASRRLVVVRTLSKAYGLAGLRIGFAVGPPQVVAEIEKSRGPYKVSRIAERAAVAAIEDREEWIPRVVAAVRGERSRLGAELRARGLAPLPSGANFVLIPVAPRSGAAVTTALRERGVAVRPFPALPGIGDTAESGRFLTALDEVLE